MLLPVTCCHFGSDKLVTFPTRTPGRSVLPSTGTARPTARKTLADTPASGRRWGAGGTFQNEVQASL